jgi:glycerol-3-phosphate acyltransferase PlsY
VVLAVLAVVVGYLLGRAPTGLLVGRAAGRDLTREGSGNPGATNAFRTVGRRAGAFVLAVDLGKGALAAGIGWAVGDHVLGLLCGLAAVVGHVAPLTRRGGKGVATSVGVVLVLYPVHGLAVAAVWSVVVVATRRPSVASLVVAAAVPVAVAATGAPGREVSLLTVLAALVVIRHGTNIGRLVRGTEAPVKAAGP